MHAGGATGRSVGADYSLVDFNRGGTPLLEIVSEPDIRSADEADRFLRLLRQTIVELGVSDAEMEKGTLRADVNVSVRKRGEDGLPPALGAEEHEPFTFIRRGIEAAVREQVAAYERGETLEQSTYDYDPDTDRLTVHRSKEEADDYRYFPEPDLVPVEPPRRARRAAARRSCRSCPGARIRRSSAEVGFDARVRARRDRQRALKAAALVEHGVELARGGERRDERARRRHCRRTPRALAKIVQRRTSTRERAHRRVRRGREGGLDRGRRLPRADRGERRVGARARDRRGASPRTRSQVETYRGGKEGVLGFLVGQVMKETQGKADPKVVNRLLREKLASGVERRRSRIDGLNVPRPRPRAPTR